MSCLGAIFRDEFIHLKAATHCKIGERNRYIRLFLATAVHLVYSVAAKVVVLDVEMLQNNSVTS